MTGLTMYFIINQSREKQLHSKLKKGNTPIGCIWWKDQPIVVGRVREGCWRDSYKAPSCSFLWWHCKCLTAPPHSLSTRSSQRPVSVLQESSPAFLQRRGSSGKGYGRRHPLVGAEELVDAFELLARLVDGGVAYTALEPPEVPLTPGRHILHRPPPTSLRFSSTFKLFSTRFSVLGLQVATKFF